MSHFLLNFVSQKAQVGVLIAEKRKNDNGNVQKRSAAHTNDARQTGRRNTTGFRGGGRRGAGRIATALANERLDWRNYRMTDQNRFVEQADGQIIVVPYPEGSNPKFSRIKVLSLTVPFTYSYYPYKHGLFRGFEVGPVLNFNVYSSIKTRYSVNGEDQKDFTKGLHRNPVTVDFMVRLQMYHFGFYAKYSPCNVLDTTYGPKFQSVSFGLYF